LFLAPLAIEAMDIVFAADSVPAVLAITRDTFIAYSSIVLALLGLRALYFAVADIFPLDLVGFENGARGELPVSTGACLAVICGVLALAMGASALAPD
jgi:tellurite resistance protein TerC